MSDADPLKGLPDDYTVTSQAFTKQTYRDVYPAIDPSNAALSQEGKVVIVTGASKGIGRQGFARSFAIAGAKGVVLVARSLNQLQEAAETLGKEFPKTQFLPVECDVRNEASVKAVFEQVRATFGTAHVLVNNAGSNDEAEPLRSASITALWDCIEINLKGSLLMVHEFLNLVGTSQEASVINVSSAMGFIVLPGKTGYCLSKLSLTQLAQFIAMENPNVRAISFHPGTIMTDITPPWLERFSRDTPALAAGCALWLTTKDAAFLNGRYISANCIKLTMKNLFTVVVAGCQYLLHPQKLGTIEQTINPDALIPVTLLTTSEINGDVDGILDLFATVDDVFQSDFGGILVEKPDKDHTIGLVQNIGPRSSRTVVRLQQIEVKDRDETDAGGFGDLPSGPYFLHGPNLYQAWRLYDDVLDAFTFGVIPNSINDTDDGYEALSSLSDNGSFKSIAVPSRLYHAAPSIRKPLSGVRISITDAASLKGVRTTLSSRAWTELHDTEATETAKFVKSLTDMGAIIVGKTKSSQFDSGREWVDVGAPWNSRGDGYQDSGGSAAGAGASVSGYDWMEYAVAQDSFDGIREQARVHGVYSIRPTAGAISLDGWQVDSQNYAVAGFLSRSLKDLLKLVQVASNMTDDNVAFPKRIVYPLDLAPIFEGNQALTDKFISALEHFLGIQADKISLADIWDSKPPIEADGQSLEEYMRQAPFSSFCAEFYDQYQDFYRSYKEKFGYVPYVEATPRFRWSVGENESEEDGKSHHERIEVFKTWFGENVMPTLQDSESIMILPFGPHHTVHYRDDLPRRPSRIDGIGSGALAPLLGLPHLIVPFAQTTYHSRVTARTESRPFSGSIMGPSGSDIMLIQLAKAAFEHSKWRSQVDAGRLAFPEGSKCGMKQ
ncbi:hypothetical protein ACQKWADRAFT_322711 [Trichoderma austrokoningii]